MNSNNQHYGPLGASGDSGTVQGSFDAPTDKFLRGTEVAAFDEAMKAIFPGDPLLKDGSQYPVGNMNSDKR